MPTLSWEHLRLFARPLRSPGFRRSEVTSTIHLGGRVRCLFTSYVCTSPLISNVSSTGDDIPDVRDLVSEVPLTLQNSHYAVAESVPYLSNVVNVACLHCRPAMQLSTDLETFLRRGDYHFSITILFLPPQNETDHFYHFSFFICFPIHGAFQGPILPHGSLDSCKIKNSLR